MTTTCPLCGAGRNGIPFGDSRVRPLELSAAGLDVRIIDSATGAFLRELTVDPTRDYQGTGAPKAPRTDPENDNTPTHNTWSRRSPMS